MPYLKPRPRFFVEENIRPVLNAYIAFFDGNKSDAHEAFIEDLASIVGGGDSDTDRSIETGGEVSQKTTNDPDETIAAIDKKFRNSGLSREQQLIVMARARENMARHLAAAQGRSERSAPSKSRQDDYER